MSVIAIHYHRSRIGDLIIGVHRHALCLLDFRYRRQRQALDQRLQAGLGLGFSEQFEPLHGQAIAELEAYLHGQQRAFSLPLHMVGTPAQLRIWQALVGIRYGSTTTYQALAQSLQVSEAAVAAASAANILALCIPCHRLQGRNGELMGYGGGEAVKRRLLRLEQLTLSPPPQTLSLFATAAGVLDGATITTPPS